MCLNGLAEAADHHVAATLLPSLQSLFFNALSGEENWTLELMEDSSDLHFSYPQTGALDWGSGYLNTPIKLELGARSDHWPTTMCSLSPYVAEDMPDLFDEAVTEFKTLDLERTFWEKTTILHRLAHADEAKAQARHLSRHLYDVVMIARSHHRDAVLKRAGLLDEVRKQTILFFDRKWARYDLAALGTLRLVPDANVQAVLRKDYDEMAEMFWADRPSFDDILSELRDLEDELNRLDEPRALDC
jgi:Nucleotidyl transferase AbiEii toxin, Type IV TA system